MSCPDRCLSQKVLVEVWILCFPIFTNSIAIIESSSRHCRLWCMAILVRILLARKTHAITISISQTNVILFALYYCVFNKADVELVTLYLWSNRESLSRNLIIKGLLICKIVSHVSGSYPSMREIIQPGIIRLLYQSSPLSTVPKSCLFDESSIAFPVWFFPRVTRYFLLHKSIQNFFSTRKVLQQKQKISIKLIHEITAFHIVLKKN